MVVKGPTVQLSNGAEMPLVGLGTWQSSPGEVGQAVRHALDCGYRLIDTAAVYGNEKEIGDVLQEYFKAGKLKREDVFITTKLWCNHNRQEEIEGALKESLAKLQLDYVDLYLSHMPTCFDVEFTGHDRSVTVEQTWKGLEGVCKKGLTKAIGISNYDEEQIERIMKTATVPIHNLQVECYIYFPQEELIECCRRHNISFTAYGPLGSPGRVAWTLPGGTPWTHAPSPLEDPVVRKMAEKHHKTPAQVLLRHLFQRGLAIIPKSVHENRIKENWDIFDFELSGEEMKELNSVKHRQRLFWCEFMKGHPEDGFKKDRKA